MANHSSDKIGGDSGLDEAVLPFLQNRAVNLVDQLVPKASIEAIRKVLDLLLPSKLVDWGCELVPSFVGWGVAQLPAGIFRSEMKRDLFKDSIIEAVRHLSQEIKKAGGDISQVSPEAYTAAIDKGFAAAAEKKYPVIDGLLHSPRCVNIQSRLSVEAPQQQGPNGQLRQRASRNPEVTLLEAEAQKIKVAPCCFEGAQAELTKSTTPAAKVEAPKPAPKSPAEVFMRAKDEDRKTFFDWKRSLPIPVRLRVEALMTHLDSVEELEFLVKQIRDNPDHAANDLALLENWNKSFKVMTVLKEIAKTAGTAINKVDKGLAPLAKKLSDNNASAQPRPTLEVLGMGRKKPRKGFWASLLNF